MPEWAPWELLVRSEAAIGGYRRSVWMLQVAVAGGGYYCGISFAGRGVTSVVTQSSNSARRRRLTLLLTQGNRPALGCDAGGFSPVAVCLQHYLRLRD